MLSKLLGKLSYANVMATLALFVALSAGAYAALRLERDSVKSKHIKDGQVKGPDLAGGVRPLGFSYQEEPSAPNQSVLEANGYEIFAECATEAGRPSLTVSFAFPTDGTLDLSLLRDGGTGAPVPTLGGLVPVEGGTPIDLVDSSPNSDGIFAGVGGHFTFSSDDGAATVSLVAIANDGGTESCRASGTITPAF